MEKAIPLLFYIAGSLCFLIGSVLTLIQMFGAE